MDPGALTRKENAVRFGWIVAAGLVFITGCGDTKTGGVPVCPKFRDVCEESVCRDGVEVDIQRAGGGPPGR